LILFFGTSCEVHLHFRLHFHFLSWKYSLFLALYFSNPMYDWAWTGREHTLVKGVYLHLKMVNFFGSDRPSGWP
jgi:hypothetical protein